MIILITDASHTGKTALAQILRKAQKHGVNYILIDGEYDIHIE